MISGRVSPELYPKVTIEFGNGKGSFQSIEVVVDTGFSGELALPPELIRSLGLEYIDDVSVALADRQARPVRAYEGVVSWQGRSRDVTVLDMGSEPLLGMPLLLGSRLTVSCRPNGAVVIEEEES
ncbi:MAG: clan AA aspartic protease [Chloroflexi bacterium]|nr:clan AA aspartic protease [Chloroflexota bacterium]